MLTCNKHMLFLFSYKLRSFQQASVKHLTHILYTADRRALLVQRLRIAWVLPAPMLQIGKYTSVPSRVITSWHKCTIRSCYEQDQGNAKWFREKATPSVSSQFLYLSHSNYGPTFIVFSCCLLQPSTLRPSLFWQTGFGL